MLGAFAAEMELREFEDFSRRTGKPVCLVILFYFQEFLIFNSLKLVSIVNLILVLVPFSRAYLLSMLRKRKA